MSCDYFIYLKLIIYLFIIINKPHLFQNRFFKKFLLLNNNFFIINFERHILRNTPLL